MDSPSGISSNSSILQNSTSEEDLNQAMDLKRTKRMISNRESARRSRLRKQKHLEELTAQVAQLRRQNHQILTNLRATAQRHVAVESENSVLRAQAAELTQRLQSLAEIAGFPYDGAAGFVGGSWSCLSQPVVMAAAADFPADFGI